jgi:hypothetical protein
LCGFSSGERGLSQMGLLGEKGFRLGEGIPRFARNDRVAGVARRTASDRRWKAGVKTEGRSSQFRAQHADYVV